MMQIWNFKKIAIMKIWEYYIEYLTKDKDNCLRITEELVLSDEYKKYYLQNQCYMHLQTNF